MNRVPRIFRLSSLLLILTCATPAGAQTRPYSDRGPLSAADYQRVLDLVPEVRFHPYERYFPTSVGEFLATSTLQQRFGTTITAPTIADLREQDSDATVALQGGWQDPLRFGNQPGPGLRVDAPMYFRVFDRGDLGLWIDFLFFYPSQGSRNIRVKYRTSRWNHHYRTFRMENLGSRQGDFRRVSLFVSHDFEHLYSLTTYKDGKPQHFDASFIEFSGTHPVVYAARDSHRNYPHRGHHMTPVMNSRAWISEPIDPFAHGLAQTGDVYLGSLALAIIIFDPNTWATSLFEDWNYDDQCGIIKDTHADGALWRPWELPNASSKVVQIGFDEQSRPMSAFGDDAAWLGFAGRWGLSRRVDPSMLGTPVVMPGEGQVDAGDLATALTHFQDALPSNARSTAGRSPLWWRSDPEYVAPLVLERPLSDGNGFDQRGLYNTIQAADIDGDGVDEILYRSQFGLHASRKVGHEWYDLASFMPLSNATGWNEDRFASTIQCADIDGDGSDEVLARGVFGLSVYKLINGVFVQLSATIPFTDATGWGEHRFYSTIQCADVNGDGREEVIARGAFGVQAYTLLHGAFTPLGNTIPLSDAAGFGDERFYSTIQTADLNGDGRAEIVFRGYFGVAAATLVGATWHALPGIAPLGDQQGFGKHLYYSTIQCADIDGDGHDELLARTAFGLAAWKHTGSEWLAMQDIIDSLGNQAGFIEEHFYGTIQTADVDGDGREEVIARAYGGLIAFRYSSTGWEQLQRTLPFPNETFIERSSWSTIQPIDIDGDGAFEIMGRSPQGLGIAEF